MFVFGLGAGRDVILDMTDNRDTLHLDDAIWGGGRTVTQVISTYGKVVGGSVVLEFSAALAVTLQGFSSLTALNDDITLI